MTRFDPPLNPRVKHVLYCALGFQAVLLTIAMIIGGGEIPLGIVVPVGLVVQIPSVLASALIRPKSPKVSFLLGMGMGLVSIAALFIYFVTNYRG